MKKLGIWSKFGLFSALVLLSAMVLVQASDPRDVVQADDSGGGPALYWTTNPLGNADAVGLWRSNLDGSGIEQLLDSEDFLDGPGPLAIGADKVYISFFDGYILQAGLDGSGLEEFFADESQQPDGVALDVANGHIYWASFHTDEIWRHNLDGTGEPVLILDGMPSVSGLALDPSEGKLYFTDIQGSTIRRVDLDGENLQTVADIGDGVDFPVGIAVDPVNDKVYWTEDFNNEIRAINSDGSGTVDIVLDTVDGVNAPSGLVLDTENGHLYWTNLLDNTIMRANLDGSNVVTIADGDDGIEGPYGIAILAAEDDSAPSPVTITPATLTLDQEVSAFGGGNFTVTNVSDANVIVHSAFPADEAGEATATAWLEVGLGGAQQLTPAQDTTIAVDTTCGAEPSVLTGHVAFVIDTDADLDTEEDRILLVRQVSLTCAEPDPVVDLTVSPTEISVELDLTGEGAQDSETVTITNNSAVNGELLSLQEVTWPGGEAEDAPWLTIDFGGDPIPAPLPGNTLAGVVLHLDCSAVEEAGTYEHGVRIETDDAENPVVTVHVELVCLPEPVEITVTTTDDAVDGDDGETSLREAIIQANAAGVPTTISLPAGTYTLDIVGADDAAQTGGLDVVNGAEVTIVGQDGADQTIIDATGLNDRVFHVLSGAELALDAVTVTGGSTIDGSGGGIYNDGIVNLTNSTVSGNSAADFFHGGGIYNDGDALTITNSTVSGNSADFGGGIANIDGALTITNSTVSGNSADFDGGGIANIDGALTITNSTVSNNTAAEYGGGILNGYGALTITNSTVSGNSAEFGGGGIDNVEGALTITNSTVSGNSAGLDGGGIANDGGTLTLTNSTLSSNSASSDGGGIYNSSGAVTLHHTIVAGNTGSGSSANDISGNVESGSSYNLIGHAGSAGGLTNGVNGNIVGEDPLLGPLADNGGPTHTHALLFGSPALDAGDPDFDPTAFDQALEHDQRGEGFARVATGTVDGSAIIDIGAFEAQTPPVALVDLTVSPTEISVELDLTGEGAQDSETVTITNNSAVDGELLSLQEVAWPGGEAEDAPWLTIDFGDDPIPADLPGNTLAGVVLHLDCSAVEEAGTYEHGVRVETDDAEDPVVIVHVELVCEEPPVALVDLTVSPTEISVELDLTGEGAQDSETVTITNNSAVDGELLSLQEVVWPTGEAQDAPWLTIDFGGDPIPAPLPGNTLAGVVLHLDCSEAGAGTHTHGVRIETDDAENAVVIVHVELVCLQAVLEITVTTTDDVVDAEDGETSLREAILQANAADDPVTVLLPAGTYALSIEGANEDAAATGDLDIVNGAEVTIVGQGGAAHTIIDATGLGDRVFEVRSGAELTLEGVTVTGGTVSVSGGGIISAGTLTLTNSTVSGNTASSGFGGGIYHGGTFNSGVLTLISSTVSGNTASSAGGIYHGGAFYTGALTLINSTLSGNSASGNGGGIYHGGTLTLTNSTVSGNTATSGGGIYRSSGAVTLHNTIVAGNTRNGAANDIFGSVAGGSSYNLIGHVGSAGGLTHGVNGNIVGEDPLLGPLADNGGPALTHALLADSPAIDAGNPAFDPESFDPALLYDQRGEGFLRVATGTVDGSARVDIGAFELEPEEEPGPALEHIRTMDGDFSRPWGIAADTAGNIYVPDTDNHRIRKIDPEGNLLETWGANGGDGTTGAGQGEFNTPQGIAIDANGNLFVADHFNHRIQKFGLDGSFIGEWGGNGSGDGQFDQPSGVAVDSSGNVYVTEWIGDRVQKFDNDGNYITSWGEQGSEDGQFNGPRGIAVDDDGNVFVSDLEHRVQKFDGSGNFITSWGEQGSGDGELNNPFTLTFGPDNHLYLADFGNNRVQIFDSSGEFAGVVDRFMQFPVVAANETHLHVAQWTVNRIDVFAFAGVEPPPVAVNDAFEVVQSGTLEVDAPGVLANDTNPNEGTLTAELVGDAASGVLTLNSDGSFTYTPNEGFKGADSFTYRTSDGEISSNAATVTIDVVGPPLAPTVSTPDSPTSATTATLTIDAEDGAEVTISGGASPVTTTGPYPVDVVVDLTPNVLNRLVISASNEFGESSPVRRDVAQDSTAPSLQASAATVLTNASTVTISVTTESGAQIVITGGGGATGTGTGSAQEFVLDLNADSVNDLSVVATDDAGNSSAPVDLAVTQDSTAPAAPTVGPLPGTTRAALVVLDITAEADSTITVTGGAATVTIDDATGASQRVTVPLTADATNSLSITATDPAGNVSTAAARSIDREPFVAPIRGLVVADDLTGASIAAITNGTVATGTLDDATGTFVINSLVPTTAYTVRVTGPFGLAGATEDRYYRNGAQGSVTSAQGDATGVRPGPTGTYIRMSVLVQPSVTGVTGGGDNDQDQDLTITGGNLAGATEVWLVSGGRSVRANVDSTAAGQIDALIQAGTRPGEYNIAVRTPAGLSALSAQTVTVSDASVLPVVNELSQTVVAEGEETTIVLSGTHLDGATSVLILPGPATVTPEVGGTATSLTIVLPDTLAVGTYTLRVVTPAGTGPHSPAVTVEASADLNDLQEDQTVSTPFTGDADGLNSTVTLTNDSEESAPGGASVSASLPAGTRFTDDGGINITRSLLPPRNVPAPDGAGEGSVALSLGLPDERVNLSIPALLQVTMAASTGSEPKVYLRTESGPPAVYELAGISASLDGVDYVPGGVVLSETDLGDGRSEFVMGVLVTHFSTYVGSGGNLSEPNAPRNVQASAGDEQATVTWDEPDGAENADITGYTVTARVSGTPSGQTATVGGGATQATVTGLTNGTAYTFTVIATNEAGNSPASSPSGAVTPIGTPAAPTNVEAAVGDQESSITWDAPADNGGSAITGYRITVSPAHAGPVNVGNQTHGTVTGLTNGVAYTFTVAAMNAAGTGTASQASNAVTPAAANEPPGAPGNVNASSGDGQVTVSWSAPAFTGGSAITGYNVTYSPGNVTQQAGPGASSLVVSGLDNGTQYTFTVAARNDAGAGTASTGVSTTPLGPVSTVSISPSTVSLAPGAQRTFSYTARDASGAVISSGTATWSASGSAGSINQSGLFTAGNTASTYTNAVTVQVSFGGQTRSASATVTVSGTSAPQQPQGDDSFTTPPTPTPLPPVTVVPDGSVTPPPPRGGSFDSIVQPDRSSVVSIPGKDIRISFPPNFYGATVQVRTRPLGQNETNLTVQPGGSLLSVFELELFDASGDSVANPAFWQPVTIAVTLTSAQVEALGGVSAIYSAYTQGAFRVYRSADGGQWQPLATTFDVATRTFFAETPGFSQFALVHGEPEAQPEPTATPDPAPEPGPTPTPDPAAPPGPEPTASPGEAEPPVTGGVIDPELPSGGNGLWIIVMLVVIAAAGAGGYFLWARSKAA